MAGTARVVKAFFSKHTVNPGGIEDGLRVLLEEYKNLVLDVEALRVEMVAETTSTMAASALVAADITTIETGSP
jgi:hypothetical protein